MDSVLSEISIGAVGAAFIAAVVSIVGLIISKESKVSDFRQAWIDSLRTELTAYLSNINLIYDASQLSYKSHEEKVAKLSPHYAALNTANFMISLRLNPSEKSAKDIIDCMNRFQEILSKESIQPADLREVERDFLIASKNLLKSEWGRVKRGEITFVLAKYFTIFFIFSILLFSAAAAGKPLYDYVFH
jgi:hypothetical protein